MSRSLVMLLLVTLAGAGCKWLDEKKTKETTAGMTEDRELLAEAQVAVQKLIVNGADCAAVKAALPETEEKIARAEKQAHTGVARSTLAMLRRQVESTVGACQ
jgi:uncharacterized protein with PhoU and TrkA domain